MKKLLVVLACVVVLLVGCGAGYANKEAGYTNKEETFYTVVYSNDSYLVVYDNYTKVMYHMTIGSYNRGNITPLYNANGDLRLWEE